MSENQNKECVIWDDSCKKCEKLPYVIIIVLLLIISVLAFFLWKNYDSIFNGASNSNINNSSWEASTNAIIKVVWDKRCTDCHTSEITAQLKKIPFLAGAKFEEVDFSDKGIKDLLKANDVKMLPAYLFDTNKFSDSQFTSFLKQTPAWLYSLDIWTEWASFDPYAEMCGNKIDDNGDWLVDCKDTKCSKDISCSAKVDKPVADLYIMSYCPYGLQAQKWYLEVMSKLSKVANINVKFVQYVMHWQKEADENVVQYCIQKEQKDKYLSYLNCYLKEEWKWAECRKESKIDETKLTSCIDKTKKEFKVDEKMADKSKQYPDFDVNWKEAIAALVQWSPTFVLNWIKIDKMWRTAKAYAEAICSTFKNKPKECEQEFQNLNFDPMFGFTSNWSSANSGCAQ